MKKRNFVNFSLCARTALRNGKFWKTALGKCISGKLHKHSWKLCVSAVATAYFAKHLQDFHKLWTDLVATCHTTTYKMIERNVHESSGITYS